MELVALASNARGLIGVKCKGPEGDVSFPVKHLFLFIGGDPNTRWLKTCNVSTDAKGFVLTGAAVRRAGDSSDLTLQTSVPGVFAIGDVRAGSTKRVAAAVGDGAAVAAQIHSVLNQRQELARVLATSPQV
jgi:thioredoxin reductase (NADPH)